MRLLKKLISVVCLLVIISLIVISCSKYECYENTHIPDFRIVCGVKHHDTFDPRSRISADGTALLNSFGFELEGVAYSKVNENDVEDYSEALIDAGFSPCMSKSMNGIICFARNQNNYFSFVIVVYDSHDLSDNQVAVYYHEYEGGMTESQFNEFLGY